MSDKIVNAIGEQCPIPVIKSMKALEEMRESGILEVHVDNETAVENLLKMAEGKGLSAKSEKREEKHYVVEIDAHAKDAGEEEAAAPSLRPVGGPTVVAIGSDKIGEGAEELSKLLMKGFIYTLSQYETLPDTVIFFNGGAKVPTEGSVSIGDLKFMESKGVEIMTCGTCLDFYGLKEKLQVGTVSNMYNIVEKLMKAGKVIRP